MNSKTQLKLNKAIPHTSATPMKVIKEQMLVTKKIKFPERKIKI